MKWTVAAVVLVAGAMLSGCEPSINREVLIIGDSVTVESTRKIVETFNNVYQDDTAATRYAPVFGSTVIGQGLTTVPQTPAEDVDEYWAVHLASLMEHVDPEVIVVELGYNDCALLKGYGARIDAFMAAIPPDTPVHWLSMADPMRKTTCDATINAEQAAAATRWPNMSRLPYASLMNPHPAWTRDGVHLTATGQGKYAEWLHKQLDAIYMDEEPPPSG